MHDLIHDLAHFALENECFTSLNSSAAPEIPIRPHHLNLYSDKNYNQADCSIIRTVLKFKTDLSVLSRLKFVRVLDLSDTHINELPASIEHLHHLRYLDLSYTKIRKLPESIYFKALPAGLSQLQNLKTLTRYTVGDEAKNNIGQLRSLNPFSELALDNLQKDHHDEYCLMENAEDVLEALKPPSGVKQLTVSYYPGKQFPIWMGEMQQFQYLHRIELSECRECEQLPPLETLPNLADLSISDMDGIKHIVNNSKGNALQSFPALKGLILYRMKNLEGWCVEEGREANQSLFPCLIRMDIGRCPKLTTMPPIPTLQELYMVRPFRKTQISLVSKERRYFTGVSSLGDSCPPFLKSLEVSGSDALRELPTCPTSLQYLKIDKCRGMESLGPEMGHLTSLSRLELSRCPKLKSFKEGLQQLLPTLKSL
ncbi:putative disease resistance protein RGA1 [Dioscorea cayenensis subsp. rotundata]|uniref:Disease resistance protein RGA1 n=1 Tax=Dioscorea cayennensis subsp. rotundata TaxID=55577 RepID=A0AB40BRJ7_DIOCR|nr:putative disease resistance protein RGA1 [Dioscorea cayenensis subsp. rotundata]